MKINKITITILVIIVLLGLGILSWLLWSRIMQASAPLSYKIPGITTVGDQFSILDTNLKDLKDIENEGNTSDIEQMEKDLNLSQFNVL